MGPAEHKAVELMIGNALTNHPTDWHRARVLLRSYEGTEDYERVKRMVLKARLRWLNYQSAKQREWQSKVSRRPQRVAQYRYDGGSDGLIRCAPNSREVQSSLRTREQYVRGQV